MNRRTVRVSVRAVLVQSDEVLLALHEHPERTEPLFWCFPGGGVEEGESISRALIRELREETGLEIAPKGVVYLQDFMERKMLDIFVAAEVVGGTLQLGSDPEPDANHLKEIRWVERSEIERLTVLPRDLAKRLADELPLPTIPFFVI